MTEYSPLLSSAQSEAATVERDEEKGEEVVDEAETVLKVLNSLSTTEKLILSLVVVVAIVGIIILFVEVGVQGILSFLGSVLGFFYLASEILKKAETAFETLQEAADSTFLTMSAALCVLILQASHRLADKGSATVLDVYVAGANLVTVATAVCLPIVLYAPKFGIHYWIHWIQMEDREPRKQRVKPHRHVLMAYVFFVILEVHNIFPLVWTLDEIGESMTSIVFGVIVDILVIFIGLMAVYERLTDKSFSDLLEKLEDDTENLITTVKDELDDTHVNVHDTTEEIDDAVDKIDSFCEKMMNHTFTQQANYRFVYLAYALFAAPALVAYVLFDVFAGMNWTDLGNAPIVIAAFFGLVVVVFTLAHINFALRVLQGKVKGVVDPGPLQCCGDASDLTDYSKETDTDAIKRTTGVSTYAKKTDADTINRAKWSEPSDFSKLAAGIICLYHSCCFGDKSPSSSTSSSS